jgi:hypothetical protein
MADQQGKMEFKRTPAGVGVITFRDGGELRVSQQPDGRLNLSLAGRWHQGAFWVGKTKGKPRTDIGLVPDEWSGG